MSKARFFGWRFQFPERAHDVARQIKEGNWAALGNMMDRRDRAIEQQFTNMGQYKDFVPVWDTSLGVSSENGTWNEARYTRIGDTVHFFAMYTVGSTFSTGGSGQERWEFTETDNMVPYLNGPFTAWTRFRDTGTDNYYAPGIITGTTTTYYNVYASGATTGTDYNINSMSATVPFTFASGDEMYFQGTFEAQPLT